MESVAVVAVPFPAQGHLNQLLHLSLRLASRGLPPARACTAGARPPSAPSCSTSSPSPSTPPLRRTPPRPRRSPPTSCPLFEAYTAGARAPLAPLLAALSASHRRVVVVHDPLNAYAAEEAARLPNAEAYGLHCLAASPRRAPGSGSSASGAPGVRRPRGVARPRTREAVVQRDLAWRAGILVNSCRALEGEFIDVKLFAIGPLNPLLHHTTSKPTRHECLDWLDKQPPASVLYVSFGTTSTLPGEQIGELAAALRDSKQRFIWVLRDADRGNEFAEGHGKSRHGGRHAELLAEFTEQIEGRGMVITGWAPQLEILAHGATAAFMSHCGLELDHGEHEPREAYAGPWDAELVCNYFKAGILVRPWEKHNEVIPAEAIREVIVNAMVSDEGVAVQQRAKVLGEAVSASLADAVVAGLLADVKQECASRGSAMAERRGLTHHARARASLTAAVARCEPQFPACVNITTPPSMCAVLSGVLKCVSVTEKKKRSPGAVHAVATEAAPHTIPIPRSMESVTVVVVPCSTSRCSSRPAALPVHFAAPPEHVRQARARVHGWADDVLRRVEFHELAISDYASPPPDPAAASPYPSHLMPLFDAFVADAPAALAALLRELSAASSPRRVVVVYDVLTAFGAEEASRLPNGEGYAFHCTAASLIARDLDGGLQLLRDAHGLDDLPPLAYSTEEHLEFVAKRARTHQTIPSSAGILMNTSRALEGELIDFVATTFAGYGKKVFSIGPLNPMLLELDGSLPDGKGVTPRHECLEWLDKQPAASVLYVSFGSLSSLRGEQIEELAAALRDSKQRFIWVLRDADRGNVFADDSGESRHAKFMSEFKKQTESTGLLITEWAPQLEILAHPATAAFLSHCGWNSTMESMSYGKPILAWPMHSDQPWDAELICKHFKAGFLVRPCQKHGEPAEVTPAATIQRMIEKMMVSEEGRAVQQRAMELGKAIRASMAADGSSHKDLMDFIAHIIR
ncbi:hypothetical protein HU200_011980 [Digitaria exilis]|uniref:Glycosyltransferase N-terminal domain-containing protein n=1 Tax=Digitaria exilis TaxID=1010633 RepID=A0A835KQ68_9POAL|nr:hypothetical protein HU200_011980 [Digitaria exilis]